MWNRKALFDGLRPLFDGHFSQPQVDGIDIILSTIEAENVIDPRHVAYIFATAIHETNHTMQPVREAYWLSESWRKSHLRYYPYYGRGFVQITWKTNYEHAGKVFGLDLVNKPDLAMVPQTAANIMVRGMVEGWFSEGNSLAKWIHGDVCDYEGARQIVNGKDQKAKIAGYAMRIAPSVKIETGAPAPVPPKSPPAEPAEPVQTPNAPEGGLGAPDKEAAPGASWAAFMADLMQLLQKHGISWN
jgi:hypothetical protein